jgi:hypothetical protein
LIGAPAFIRRAVSFAICELLFAKNVMPKVCNERNNAVRPFVRDALQLRSQRRSWVTTSATAEVGTASKT